MFHGWQVGLIIPTLNEEKTIGKEIVIFKSELMTRYPLLDEIAVIDSGSTDRTREIAAEFGADVYLASDILPHLEPKRGKGENLWKAIYQLKGDIAVRIRPLDGSPPNDVVIREGEMWLCPRWVPHRPQRPADTVGLIVEFPRVHENNEVLDDGLRWYCEECDNLVHEASFRLAHIDKDLHEVMDNFWNGPVEGRTCKNCGVVIERAGEFSLTSAPTG